MSVAAILATLASQAVRLASTGDGARSIGARTRGLPGSATPGQRAGNAGDPLPCAAKCAANLSAIQLRTFGGSLAVSVLKARQSNTIVCRPFSRTR
ncbi:MAG TPA: hypothetical protein VFQ57_00810 [Sphingomonas sp.]|jgi:hypothetical protein|nr:hypothetical protein [Sphingomonas sp.]